VLYFAVRTVAETPVEIPNRAAFKASEVCEIAQIPPYVLRSWEKEFPGLGAAARPGGPRIYRREDVEQILRIKRLVFTEGLTLSGARRQLEGEPPADEVFAPPETIPDGVKSRVDQARRDLRELLTLLSMPAGREARAETADAAPGAAVEASQAGGATGADTPSASEGGPAEGLLPLLGGSGEPAAAVNPARRGRAAKRK
jgi:DNA-binding transcriptional MerR regulator